MHGAVLYRRTAVLPAPLPRLSKYMADIAVWCTWCTFLTRPGSDCQGRSASYTLDTPVPDTCMDVCEDFFCEIFRVGCLCGNVCEGVFMGCLIGSW